MPEKVEITPEDLAQADVLLTELCQLRDEYPSLTKYWDRQNNLTERQVLVRQISKLYGSDLSEESAAEIILNKD
jgi:hypothetical protein